MGHTLALPLFGTSSWHGYSRRFAQHLCVLLHSTVCVCVCPSELKTCGACSSIKKKKGMQLLCESVREKRKTQNSLCACIPSCVRFVHVRAYMKLHRADTCGTGAPVEEREGHAVIFIFAPGSKTSASRVQDNAAPVTCLHAGQMRGHILPIKPACKPGPLISWTFLRAIKPRGSVTPTHFSTFHVHSGSI